MTYRSFFVQKTDVQINHKYQVVVQTYPGDDQIYVKVYKLNLVNDKWEYADKSNEFVSFEVTEENIDLPDIECNINWIIEIYKCYNQPIEYSLQLNNDLYVSVADFTDLTLHLPAVIDKLNLMKERQDIVDKWFTDSIERKSYDTCTLYSIVTGD